MKIAVVRGNEEKNDEVLNVLKNKYNYDIFNVDSIVKKTIDSITLNASGYSEYCEIMNNLKNRINSIIINEINSKENIAVSFSLLEDLGVYEDFDINIRVNNNKNIFSNSFDLYAEYRCSLIDSKEHPQYHLKLDDNINIESSISEYMENMVYNDTKVTVIVPIYNTEKYISRLVNSVIDQTYRNLEIVLIDDGSTDKSLEICNLLASTDSRIKVIHQENSGLAETRNNGIKIATGEYISFLDSDDYIDSTMYAELVKRAKETKADICQGGFFIHMKDGTIKDVTAEQKGPQFFEDKRSLIEAHSDHLISIAAWDKLYKLDAIKNVKFDNAVTKEDADYIFRLCNMGKTVAIVNKPFYHYIKRPFSSITADKISSKLFLLQSWGHNAYDEVLKNGIEYQDSADKILYNSLVHIIRNYIRDFKKGVLYNGEFQSEMQSVVNDLINLLLHSQNVKKFRKLDEVLEIINELIENKIIDKKQFPSINIPCVGILWNSLDERMMKEAIDYISKTSDIRKCIKVDLDNLYRDFINEIYSDTDQYIGVPSIKAGSLIDRYSTNDIVILNLIVKVSNYIYNNQKNEYIFEEINELKLTIRNLFRKKIKNYAYDNIFHLTVNVEDYERSDNICRKYIKQYNGDNNYDEDK